MTRKPGRVDTKPTGGRQASYAGQRVERFSEEPARTVIRNRMAVMLPVYIYRYRARRHHRSWSAPVGVTLWIQSRASLPPWWATVPDEERAGDDCLQSKRS